MPIYEYQCDNCYKIYEIWQKISDTPPGKCTECGGPLHKLVSLSSFELKGGGWYVDGYSTIQPNGKREQSIDKKGNITKENQEKNAKSSTTKSFHKRPGQ